MKRQNLPGPAFQAHFASSPTSQTQRSNEDRATDSVAVDGARVVKRKLVNDDEDGVKQTHTLSEAKRNSRMLRKSKAWKLAMARGGKDASVESICSILKNKDSYNVDKTVFFVKEVIIKSSRSLEAASCLFMDSTGEEIMGTLDDELCRVENLSAGAVVWLENVSVLRVDRRAAPHLVVGMDQLKFLFTSSGSCQSFVTPLPRSITDNLTTHPDSPDSATVLTEKNTSNPRLTLLHVNAFEKLLADKENNDTLL